MIEVRVFVNRWRLGCALTGLFPGEMPMDEVINKSEGKREDKYSGDMDF